MGEGVISGLKKSYAEKLSEDLFLPKDRLDACYALFRQRFGPEVLKELQGEALLEKLHGRGAGDSLVYWLEFKNDAEFPTVQFGGIGGGSALKFGLYKSKETGKWMAGSPQSQREIALGEAVELAERQRSEILKGFQVLASFTGDVADADFEGLQKDLEQSCPTVADTAWGHKYFSLLFSDLLPHVHSEGLQRYQLVKLRQAPPPAPGRYVCSGRFIALTRELGIPLNHFTALLSNVYGVEHAYWRVGTRDGDSGESQWDSMRDGACVAIGWPGLPDLSHIEYKREDKEWLREQLHLRHPTAAQTEGRYTQQIFNFVTVVKEGDLVVAADGQTVRGVGRVTGPYFYEGGAVFPHRRPVEWLSLREWKMPDKEGLQTTVSPLKKNSLNLIAIEEAMDTSEMIDGPGAKPSALPRTVAEIEAILKRKGQAIIYGPPGTGKTYWAMVTAREMVAREWFQKAYDELTPPEKARVDGGPNAEGLVRTCCFHPGYGYEEFLEGYRPQADGGGGVAFALRDGIFVRACDTARASGNRPVVLIVDEINRGDVPRIFGELMLCLEKDKRERTVTLPMSGRSFSVPANLYLIGTMNTADRSISLLDAALRRRFGFLELMPDASLLGDTVIEGIQLGPWFKELNSRILANVGRDARNLQVGHAYFMDGSKPIADWSRFARVLQEDVIPLLEEYCYEDYAAMAAILGPTLVKAERQRVEHRLFRPETKSELVEAVRALGGEVLTTTAALVESGANQEDLGESEDDEG